MVSTANRNATFAGAAAFLLILAGMSILLLWESEDNSAITVDGEVGDWTGISQTGQETNNVDSANIDIVGTSAYTDSIYLSLLDYY